MVGLDTVKVVASIPPNARLHLHPSLEPNRMSGRKGVVWYQGYDVPSLGTSVVVKGVGASSGHIMWEGSVPKALGLESVAGVRDLAAWESALVDACEYFNGAHRTRFDVTADLQDENGMLRVAALGWKPHDRARYVQAVYQGMETVWLHNKTRGVRVYDKYAECGHEWAHGKTRLEYQLRGEWVQRHGLRGWSQNLEENLENAIVPLVTALTDRAEAMGGIIGRDVSLAKGAA